LGLTQDVRGRDWQKRLVSKGIEFERVCPTQNERIEKVLGSGRRREKFKKKKVGGYRGYDK